MKAFIITSCVLVCMISTQAQGIKLLYKGNQPGGWNNTINWIQLNTPAGQAPIQRVPTELDDVIVNGSQGSSSLNIEFDATNPTLCVGGSATTGYRCRSLHISGTSASFQIPNLDQGGRVEVWTNNGGFVIIDSGSYVSHGIFILNGGDKSIADLEIKNSTMGSLFSHVDRADVFVNPEGVARFINSTLAGFNYAAGPVGGNIYAENCTFKTTKFQIGDNGRGSLINCSFSNDANNVTLRFLIGRTASFYSENLTITSYMELEVSTSGNILSANLKCIYATGDFRFSQADPLHPLPNIIDGNISFNEKIVHFTGDLKLSGNFIHYTPPELFYGDSTHVTVNGQDVLTYGGSPKYNFTLEFFGSGNSIMNWPLGFRADTLVINKTNCGKVDFIQPIYITGETRILGGQLVLNRIDSIPYKLICEGDLNIFPGGGLFMRKNENGKVAGIAVGGNIRDYNTTVDSLCQGFSNPYGGEVALFTRANSAGSNLISTASNANMGNFNFISSGGSTITMNSPLTVNNFTFTNPGKFLLGDHDLTINGSIFNADNQKYFITNGTGSLKMNNLGSMPLIFPVGPDANSYNPATLQNIGTADQFSVRVKPNVLTAGISGQAYTSGIVNSTWFVEEAVAGGSDVSLTTQWNAADELPDLNRNSLYLSHYINGGWVNGTILSASGDGPYMVTRTSISSFSPFAVMSTTGALPLRLVSFAGQYNSKQIDLMWITESELNTKSFSVEKSEDANIFKSLAALPAKGTVLSRNHYTYTDVDITKAANYYRLKILDKDGKIDYSKTIVVNAPAKESFHVFPNPARKEIFISRINTPSAATINMADAYGRLIKSERIQPGMTSVYMDIENLPAGMYTITLETGFSKDVRQFLKK